jgi:transcriptional regulator
LLTGRGAGCQRPRDANPAAASIAPEARLQKMAKLDLLQGTLDLLILKTLALGPQHGWGISQRIQQISENVLRVNQGSLYPALQRLDTAGYIESEWGASDNNRQAKFYRLTRRGERQLKEEAAQWARMTVAVQRILETEA